MLDTGVMVDVVRGYRPAVQWLASLRSIPGLPGYVVMELMDACRDRAELAAVKRHLAPFPLYWPTEADSTRALETFARGKMTCGTGILDALIGECAVGLGATFCTFDVRHFKAISNLTTEQPYSRQP